MVNEVRLILSVNRLPGHNGWPKRELLKNCRDEKDLKEAIIGYLAGRRSSRFGVSPDLSSLFREAEIEEKKLKQRRIGYRLLGEADYPVNLGMISDPPLLLYYRGNFGKSEKAPLAVVGTRRPTAQAKREAYKIALELALASYPVVSGLAFGIDRSAHEGALEGNGTTWAVLASGLDRPSPYSHRALAARILDHNGALLGEIPPGQFPAKYAFPRRNRILSGLCKGTLIVQAPGKSGALITANFALDQNRDVYVGSSGLSGPNTQGTRDLEQQGAPIVQSAADILSDWAALQDIRRVHSMPAPDGAEALVRLMKAELDGNLYRHTGGCFEYRGT